MEMSFYWTTELKEFFLKCLKINSVTSFVIACIACGLLSIAYEGIKVYTAYARAKNTRELIGAVSCAPSESANLLVTDNSSNTFSKRFCRLINETIVFLFHNTLGYIVMLSTMYYNGWLFLAVVLSMGVGYFFFGHIALKINLESIQARTTKVICSPSCAQACAEAGTSAMASKTAENCCPSAPQQPETAVHPYHENQMMCEVNSSPKGCHDDDEKSPSNNEAVAEENCSCHL